MTFDMGNCYQSESVSSYFGEAGEGFPATNLLLHSIFCDFLVSHAFVFSPLDAEFPHVLC